MSLGGKDPARQYLQSCAVATVKRFVKTRPGTQMAHQRAMALLPAVPWLRGTHRTICALRSSKAAITAVARMKNLVRVRREQRAAASKRRASEYADPAAAAAAGGGRLGALAAAGAQADEREAFPGGVTGAQAAALREQLARVTHERNALLVYARHLEERLGIGGDRPRLPPS